MPSSASDHHAQTQTTAGGRLRLGLLLATAAAILFVPAGQAAAEHGEPHLTVNMVGEEGGGGEVVSPGSVYPPEITGTPAIACVLPEGGSQEGVCENEMPYLSEEEIWDVGLGALAASAAVPAPNSEFAEWEMTGSPVFPFLCFNSNPTESLCQAISTGENVEATAIFKCREGKECPGVPLTLKKTGTGKGAVESSQAEPEGIDCGLECEEGETRGFVEGSTVTLTAAPDGESVFLGWHGADAEAAGCDGTGATPTCEVVMSEAREVEAEFAELIPHALTVEASGEGSVSAAAQPAPQSGEISACEEAGGECAAEYGEGQTVTLEASPGAEKVAEWEGCDSEPSLTECEVVIPAEDATVKAEFVEAPKGTLTVEVTGEGSVDAAEPPVPISGGISGCEEGGGAECSAEYFQGDTVTLAATPGEHKEVQWTGCGPVGGEPTKCEVEVDGATVEVEVEFVQIVHTLTVNTTGAGSGTVECAIDGGGFGSCAGPIDEGSSVEVKATPAAHSTFDGFSAATGSASGCEAEGSPCSFTLEEGSALTATFAQITHTLTVNTAGSGSGSVSCDGGPCAASYPESEEVTLTANADSGSSFASWSGGGCSGAGACVVTLEADTTVTATFDADENGGGGGGDDNGGSTPPPPPPETCLTNAALCNPGLLIANPAAQVKGNKALLKVRCRGEAGARCRGVLKLIAKVRIKGKKRNVLVGKSRYNLPTNSAVRILRAKLTGKGIKLVRRAGKRGLKVKLTGKGVRNRAVKLKQQGGGKKRNRRRAGR